MTITTPDNQSPTSFTPDGFSFAFSSKFIAAVGSNINSEKPNIGITSIGKWTWDIYHPFPHPVSKGANFNSIAWVGDYLIVSTQLYDNGCSLLYTHASNLTDWKEVTVPGTFCQIGPIGGPVPYKSYAIVGEPFPDQQNSTLAFDPAKGTWTVIPNWVIPSGDVVFSNARNAFYALGVTNSPLAGPLSKSMGPKTNWTTVLDSNATNQRAINAISELSSDGTLVVVGDYGLCLIAIATSDKFVPCDLPKTISLQSFVSVSGNDGIMIIGGTKGFVYFQKYGKNIQIH